MSWIVAAPLFLLAAAWGMVGTLAARSLARRIGFVNHPNPIVPQHTSAVAYMGGLGIAVGLIMGLVTIRILGGLTGMLPANWLLAAVSPLATWGLALCGAAFLILGVVDDRWALRVRWKFGGQLGLAALAVALGIRHSFTGLFWIDAALSGFWILLLINAFNLTDVCDGLVAGIALLVFLGLAGVSGQPALALAVGGACLGVLRFNAPKASIFLGDAGSHLIGFLVAALTLLGAAGQPLWPYAAQTLLLTGIVLFELVFLVLVRTRKGLRWWLGSPDHFSLRLQAAGLSRWRTDLVAWGLTAFLVIGALLLPAVGLPAQLIMVLIAGLVLLTFGLVLLRWEVAPK